MSPRFADWGEGALELAVVRATEGLSAERERELFDRVQPEDLERFDHSVAAIHLAHVRIEEPPADLVERLEQSAFDTLRPRRSPARLTLLLSATGWAAAAGLLALLLFSPSDGAEPGAVERRARLVAEAIDVRVARWEGTDDPLADGVRGDVAWSADRQEGYLRIRDLRPNDPEAEHYQLWIFDTSRRDWEEEPVDGGVFDVRAGAEVVVPIDPKLVVRDAALFAVTLEERGGVVVSDRERLVLTAAP